MQKQAPNNSIVSLLHIADPLLNYLLFFLHMYITCYITFLLYFAIRPVTQGTICIVSFFIDWNLIALLTLPLLKRGKKAVQKPIIIFVLILVLIPLFLLVVSLSENNIVLSVQEGIRHYMPIFIRPFLS